MTGQEGVIICPEPEFLSPGECMVCNRLQLLCERGVEEGGSGEK